MLFMVISTPRPERPTGQVSDRKRYWVWMNPLLESGTAKWVYARTGRGAVALFDVPSNEELHRLMNEWADIIPAHMEVFPLIDVANAQQFLAKQEKA